MNKEDKELLLKDLCARLPYGVICKRYENAYELVDIDIKRGLVYLLRDEQYVPYSIISGDEVKPYLRPMSSMTEEERKEWEKTFDSVYDLCPGGDPDNEDDYDSWHNEPCVESFDWLNAHHFDFRNLIERGLAIEVTKENNPYKL